MIDGLTGIPQSGGRNDYFVPLVKPGVHEGNSIWMRGGLAGSRSAAEMVLPRRLEPSSLQLTRVRGGRAAPRR